MLPDLRERYTFESFRHFGNQPRDKDGFRNSIKIKILTGSELLSSSAQTLSIPTALLLFKLLTVLKTSVI